MDLHHRKLEFKASATVASKENVGDWDKYRHTSLLPPRRGPGAIPFTGPPRTLWNDRTSEDRPAALRAVSVKVRTRRDLQPRRANTTTKSRAKQKTRRIFMLLWAQRCGTSLPSDPGCHETVLGTLKYHFYPAIWLFDGETILRKSLFIWD